MNKMIKKYSFNYTTPKNQCQTMHYININALRYIFLKINFFDFFQWKKMEFPCKWKIFKVKKFCLPLCGFNSYDHEKITQGIFFFF